LEVNAQGVERTAEAIGGDIARRQQQQIQRALQLDLPVLVGEPIPILYLPMDGTGVPVVRKETEGRKAKTDGGAGAFPRSKAASICLLAPAFSKPAAKPSSALASSSPACSGQSVAPMPSWRFAALTSITVSKLTGRTGVPPDSHLYVAHPCIRC
jgi:hypothetical protein